MWLLLILPIIILAVVLLYISAAQSRKSYRCPKCGEKVRVEYMDTSRCGMCGAHLKREETQ